MVNSQEDAGSLSAQDVGVQLPVIVYIPNTFSDAEKQELQSKVLDPFIDWHSYLSINPEDKFVSVLVNKYVEGDYLYGITALTGAGGDIQFVHGDMKSGFVPVWVPDCMSKCEFNEAYSKKYPEVIKEYNRQ